MSTYRISELAARTGVPASTLRFYETVGLLPAGRTASGHRVYGDDAIERLAFIGTAKRLGMSLEEIADLLSVWSSGTCADVRDDLRSRVAGKIADAERRISALEDFTVALHRTRDHLDAVPDRSARCDAACGFPRSDAALPVPPPRAGLEHTRGRSGVPGQAGTSIAPPRAFARDRPGVLAQAETSAVPPWEPRERERPRAVPVACTLAASDAAERVAKWRRTLRGAESEDIPGGRRLTLPAGRAATVAALAADERRCCPFFDFRLHFGDAVVHLEVHAPADALGMVAELFAPAG